MAGWQKNGKWGKSTEYTVCKRAKCTRWWWNTQLAAMDYKCSCGAQLPRPKANGKDKAAGKSSSDGT